MKYLRPNERKARVARSMVSAVACTLLGMIQLFVLLFIENDHESYEKLEPVPGWLWLMAVTFIIVGIFLFIRGYISYEAAENAR